MQWHPPLRLARVTTSFPSVITGRSTNEVSQNQVNAILRGKKLKISCRKPSWSFRSALTRGNHLHSSSSQSPDVQLRSSDRAPLGTRGETSDFSMSHFPASARGWHAPSHTKAACCCDNEVCSWENSREPGFPPLCAISQMSASISQHLGSREERWGSGQAASHLGYVERLYAEA